MLKISKLKTISFLAIIMGAFFIAKTLNKKVTKEKSNVITFVANSETKGDNLNPSTMDYFKGTQYPHLSLLVPYLKKHHQPIEIVDWEDETVNWLTKDKIILGPVWGYTKSIDKFIAWLDQAENKQINLVNHPKFLKWNLTKTYLLDLSKKNIATPNTLIIDSDSPLSFDEAKNIFYKNFQERNLILKGVVDSGSFGYMHVQPNKLDVASDHFEKLKERNHGAIIQNFIPEIQKKGELSFVFFDNEISHFFVKVPKSNEERTQPFYGGRSLHLNDENLENQIRIIKSNFRPDLELDGKDVKNAHSQAQAIYDQLLLLLDDLSIPHPKYLRIDGVMVDKEFVVMELEGIEPYLEMQEAMNNDKSNNVLQRYAENVLGVPSSM